MELRGKRVANYREGREHGPGSFWYDLDENGKPEALVFITPTSDTSEFRTTHLGRASFGPGGWVFSGTLDEPTLYPSLDVTQHNSTGLIYRWHGWLNKGIFSLINGVWKDR